MQFLALKSLNFTFLISRAHKVPYVKNRQEASCSPCCQASHFQADYLKCFIKFDVRKDTSTGQVLTPFLAKTTVPYSFMLSFFFFLLQISALYPWLIARLWHQIPSRCGRLEKSLLAMLLVIQIKMVHGYIFLEGPLHVIKSQCLT